MNETTDIVKGNSPADMMQVAISGGMDLDKLEKFMELQERHEAREAKKAYTEAMAEFKKKPPDIEKDRHVSYATQKGTTEYNHATLANVTKKINDGLSKHGLTASWSHKQDNGNVSVTCKITHKLGHSEETTLTASPDTSGSKNSIQAIGSTITYLQRYTLLSLVGLATKDMDDDGHGAEIEYIDDKQVSQLTDMMNDVEADEEKFLAYLKIESLDKLPAKTYNLALESLKAKKKAKDNKNDNAGDPPIQ